MRKNRDLISFLRTTLRAEMHELNLGLKVSTLGLPGTAERRRGRVAPS